MQANHTKKADEQYKKGKEELNNISLEFIKLTKLSD